MNRNGMLKEIGLVCLAIGLLMAAMLLVSCDDRSDGWAEADAVGNETGEVRLNNPDSMEEEDDAGWLSELPGNGTADLKTEIQTCQSNEECDSGICVFTKDGMACSTPCVEDCPEGWSCKELPTGPDTNFACLPNHITLCRPCDDHEMCQLFGYQAGALCTSFGDDEGSFCSTPCSGSIDCPAGYACDSPDGSESTATFCYPENDTCECDDVAVQEEQSTTCVVENEIGTCTGQRVCTAEGLTACDAKVPAEELCDGEDNDCDGTVDEGNPEGGGECSTTGEGECDSGIFQCVDGALVCQAESEGTPEECDGKDNDCDGETDEKDASGCTVYYIDHDNDGHGVASATACLCEPEGKYSTLTAGDCDDADDTVYPGAKEVCDGKDNDCNGETDPNGIPGSEKYFKDGDEDGYGNGNISALQCAPSAGYPTKVVGDCNDNDPEINPGHPEVCDGKDNNCDSVVDGDVANVQCSTDCGVGLEVCVGGQLAACSAPIQNSCTDYGSCEVYTTCEACSATPAEQCNGEDDDCDGQIDEDIPTTTCGLGTCEHTIDACHEGIIQACDPMEGWSEETCNGVDDNCDGDIDEGLLKEFYPDADGDGYGDPNVLEIGCVNPGAYVLNALDCDDTNDAVKPGGDEVCDGLDNDCDGVVDTLVDLCDFGCGQGSLVCENGVWSDCLAPSPKSCMDYSDCVVKEVCVLECAPVPAELCNGVDDDCDGAVDEGAKTVFYLDADGDGYGIDSSVVEACAVPAGYAQLPGDCNDGSAAAHPAAVEVCDGIDNDCDLAVDENLGSTSCGIGPCAHTVKNCAGGFSQGCDALEGASAEKCDGVDNDCNGQIDDGNPGAGGQCNVPGKLGECAVGIFECFNGGLSCQQTNWSGPETCDGKDNNCNGQVDEGNPAGGGQCQVSGTSSKCALGVMQCQNGSAQCVQQVFGTPEVCDNEDNDCDGQVDEGNPGGGFSCNVPGQQGECQKGEKQCQNGSIQCVQLHWPQSESCNGKDDDCNGQVDGITEECGNNCYSGTRTCNWGSWSQCTAPQPECTSGPCCDGCNYLPSNDKCSSTPYQTEYKCTTWDKCGGKAQKRQSFKYCTGSSTSCGTGNVKWDNWTTLDSCASEEPCYAGSNNAYCKSSCDWGCLPGGTCDSNPCANGACDVEVNVSKAELRYKGGFSSIKGGCSNAGGYGWHNGTCANNICIPFAWTSSCAFPSTSNLQSYQGYWVRWKIVIEHEGTYKISAKQPAPGYACTYNWKDPSQRYANNTRYGLEREGESDKLSGYMQASNFQGEWMPVFGSVHLEAGTHWLMLYDNGETGNICNYGNPLTSKWVFVDSVKAEFLN